MKVKYKPVDMPKGDMTAMIDMVFQLIAFFMVLINFSQTESNDRVKLPSSQLVKPPDGPLEFPIILHIARDGEVILGGETYSAETLRVGLMKETAVMKMLKKSSTDANVIIRAHQDCAAGNVQEVIRVAQEQDFENFALRAQEDRT
jgi:biopolymer transport protein ExbD